ncbi:MAG: ATP-binding cassette domain-containing protein [Candidatus Eisenbacteria bacterium]|nr:ATP-binding cassette domain-containing protein [Candidatus Eisenbacteria bacterium]
MNGGTATLTARRLAIAVEARGLRHRFGPRVALEPQTFSFGEGGVVAATGPNGSGKSTLLRIVAGLLRPSGGESVVTLDGRAISAFDRRKVLGFSSPELSFYDEFTTSENLEFAARSALAALERVNLAERAGDRVGTLSSGLRQRLRLAFATLGDPPLLLLDEPGSHLDDDGHALVERVVREGAGRGLVLLATNDEREWRLAERRIQLRGRDLGHSA